MPVFCLNVKYFFQPFEVLTADNVCTYLEKTYKKANPIRMTTYAKINPPNLFHQTLISELTLIGSVI